MSTMTETQSRNTGPYEGALAAINGLRVKQQEFRSQPPCLNLEDSVPARSQVVCIASGKGGTGKTFVASNLSVILAAMGFKVTLVDADLGLANAHFLLGVTPKYDISHLMRGERRIEEILVNGPRGMRLVSGGSGYSELTMLADSDLSFLASELMLLENSSDIIIVDLPAGITPQVIRFLNVAHDIILVSNHEIAAQSDALGTMKMLAETIGAATVHLVINRARDREHAVVAFQQIWNQVNRRWRGRIKLFFSGWVPNNWYVQSSVILRKPVVLVHPQSLPTRCLQTMGEKLAKHHLIWRNRQVGRWAVPSAFARLELISKPSR